MSGISGRLADLEQVQRQRQLSDPISWREHLAERFAARVYDGYREAIIGALCGESPRCEFEVTDGPQREQGRYVIGWPGREQGWPPYVLQYTKHWRSTDGNEASAQLAQPSPEPAMVVEPVMVVVAAAPAKVDTLTPEKAATPPTADARPETPQHPVTLGGVACGRGAPWEIYGGKGGASGK